VIGFFGPGHACAGQNPGQFFAVRAVHFPEIAGGLQVEPVSRIDLENRPRRAAVSAVMKRRSARISLVPFGFQDETNNGFL